jgi:Cupin-like domain
MNSIPAAATVTTITTTTTTRHLADEDHDDAKYDVRVKQRLLRNQNKHRQIGAMGRRKKKTQHSFGALSHIPLSICILLVISSLCLLTGLVTVMVHLSVAVSQSASHPTDQIGPAVPSNVHLPRGEALPLQHHRDPRHVFPSTTSNAEQFQILRSLLLAQPSSEKNNNAEEIAARSKKLSKQIVDVLQSWLQEEDAAIVKNVALTSPRWIRPYLLPPIRAVWPNAKNGAMDDKLVNDRLVTTERRLNNKKPGKEDKAGLNNGQRSLFFRVTRRSDTKSSSSSSFETVRKTRAESTKMMQWQREYKQLLAPNGTLPGPAVDYTRPDWYTYPEHITEPPEDASYPPLQSLGDLMRHWPQDDDVPRQNNRIQIHEQLQHFDFQDPAQMQLAERYRDAELPFKLYNIPELDRATRKWTDDYVARAFDAHAVSSAAKGTAQESRHNYFAFYVAKLWDLERMGLPPTRNNDWDFGTWAQHAAYADAVRLPADWPHFYWQSGVPPEERYQHERYHSFISRDLPLFSSRKDNFFVFHVQEQKGIQCRFGERGVVAATHFDSGRNMVAMVQGAKRYILSPPNQCSKLGIFTNKRSPIYRHSLLNFGHIALMNDTTNTMSTEERQWLQRAATSQAVETVLKQGEVLYIPSHWFHYIVSLQKSAQCNVRSGIDMEGTYQFGGRKEVEECID